MDSEQSRLYDILIRCLKKDPSAPDAASMRALSSQDWSGLLALAAGQRVTPFLWYRLKQKRLEAFVPETADAALRESLRVNTLNNLRLNGELSKLLGALEKENIPLILLKGIVLANTVYESIGLREMNDIDVLGHPADLTRIADILAESGYMPVQPVDVDIAMQTGHHLPRLIKNGFAGFEIHWNLTRAGESYSIDPRGLWERAVPMQIAGRETLMLSPEDLFLHVCLHTSYQHPFIFGLRPFCDIAGMVDHFGSALDWQTVMNRACDQGWQRGVYLALCLAVELAGAAVPDHVLEKLKPSDMSEMILETARAQIFTEKYFAASIPKSFAKLLESRRWTDKIKIFIQRVFLPKAVIAGVYGVSASSPKIYFFYLRRLIDVVLRHGSTLLKYQQKDNDVKFLAKRSSIIIKWMG